ncbi:MAG: hypothetical protein KME16_24215 [Scytolyngbya sp. HA4215-MV1]|jgi:hypothetical protein|nr:hypothetical protein [Scytolyngbya sp. HA4215-MV1]
MNFTQFLSTWLRPVRFLLAIAVCAMLLISNVQPAAAFGMPKSSPSEGATQFDKVLDESGRFIESGPPSMEDVQSGSQKGINEVQKDADADKMKNAQNSQQATSVEEQVKHALEKTSTKG